MEKKRQYYVFRTYEKAPIVNFVKNLVEAPKSIRVCFYCGKNLLVVCHGLTYSEAARSYDPIIQIRCEDNGGLCEVVVDPQYLLDHGRDTVQKYFQDTLLVSGVDDLMDRGFSPVDDIYNHGYIVSFSPYYPGPLVKFHNNELLDAACDYLGLDKNQILTDSEILSKLQEYPDEVSRYVAQEVRETFLYSLIPEARKMLSAVGKVDHSMMLYRFVIQALLKHLEQLVRKGA